MGNHVRIELIGADKELGRFVRCTMTEFEKLGLPKVTAFAKLASTGGHRLIGTPDDPTMEAVGRFFWDHNDVQRRLMFDRYASGDTDYIRAKRASMSVRRMYVEYDRLLSELRGVLKTFSFYEKQSQKGFYEQKKNNRVSEMDLSKCA